VQDEIEERRLLLEENKMKDYIIAEENWFK
jgi:hypothetical protein